MPQAEAGMPYHRQVAGCWQAVGQALPDESEVSISSIVRQSLTYEWNAA